ncbi:MAG: hypothetical protein PHV34_20000 [Verrucomicrobiae bacterium]|nr:hypothetical protein [Verrucomicrobiae bacterium]
MRVRFCVVLLSMGLVLTWMGAMGQSSPAPGQMSKFTIPERDRSGVLLWQMSGEKGVIRPDGKLEVDQLVVSTYRQAKLDWTLTTEKCIFNRENREVIGEAPVRIVSDKMEITGVGFHWVGAEGRFIIRNKIKLVIAGGLSKI